MHFELIEWTDRRAVELRTAMDAESAATYADVIGAQSPETREAISLAFIVDPNEIVDCVLAIDDDGSVVGHAALRPWRNELEVKKVFVPTTARGRGVARALMTELERLAAARGIHSLVLQTGHLQVAAIRLYESMGYERIEAFRGYAVVPAALCFRKILTR